MADSTRAAWAAFRQDMNSDGQLTLTDVWLWAVQVFFLPGDGFIWLLLSYAPGLARFLEIGSDSYGGLFSAIVSVATWLFALVMIGALYSLVLDFDRALTRRIARVYGECLRRARVTRIWLGCQLWRLRQTLARRTRASESEIALDEIALDDLELEVLRSHALLAPGYVLSVSDLAASLDIRRAQAERLLVKLEQLTLLQRAFGAADGETGYRLSRPGHFLLMARSRLART